MASPESTVGRDSELASIGAFLDEPRERVAALLIEGDVGIGKSTLWQEAVRSASDRSYRVLTCRPTETETGIAYAGLIDLLGPVADEALAVLPPPQRQALDVALMRSTPEASMQSGAVGIALCGALRAIARTGALLIAVDDLQWLDVPTRQALGFALRRLDALPIAVIVTRRAGLTDDTLIQQLAVVRLKVEPLSLAATYQLVHRRLDIALARPALARIHETSGGNPFFALEFARAVIERGGGVAAAEPLPVSARLGDLLRERLERLPDATRRVLLLTAAMATPSVNDLRIAAGGQVEAEIAIAEKAGVLDSSDGMVRFTHPLLAAAVYGAAPAAERRTVHRKLAAELVDPDERARHLALAVPAPDEELAATLDAAALRMARRGASEMAARFAQQALETTPAADRAGIFRRATSAGTYWVIAGDRPRARALFESAVADASPGPDRGEALRSLAELSTPLGHGLVLCDRALLDAGDDAAVSSRIHRTYGAIAYFLGEVAQAEAHTRLGVEFAEGSGDAQALGMAIAELAHWTYCGGGGVRRDLFERAIALDGSAGALSPRSHMAKVLMDSDSLDEARKLLLQLLNDTMERGDLQSASSHEFHLAELEMWAGHWPGAIGHAEESLQLRQHLDQPSAPLYVAAMARACQGQVAEARRLAETGLAEARRAEDVVFQMQNLHVLGFVELSLGNHQAAHVSTGEATDLLRPRWHREFGDCHVVPDEIESLVVIGDLVRAEDLTSWMEEVGTSTQRAWTLATAGRSRALVQAARNDLGGAIAELEQSLQAHDRLGMPFELGRTLLIRGIVLRRMRQRSAARASLEHSLQVFEELGATLWAARAREEIGRIGVRSAAQIQLTPIERRIAALVAEGLTNRQIAAMLSLSTKTVEANLSRTYRKLGIRSRAELAAKLSDALKPSENA